MAINIAFLLATPKANGTIPVRCRITIKSKPIYFNTDFLVNGASEFDEQKGRFTKRKEANNTLSIIQGDLIRIYQEHRHEQPTAKRIKELYLSGAGNTTTIVQLIDLFIASKQKNALTAGTMRVLKHRTAHLKNFVKDKGLLNIPAREFYYLNVKDFDSYLQEYRATNGKPLIARKYIHDTVASVFLYAVEQSIITETPYKKFKKPKIKASNMKEYLTLHELNRLYHADTSLLSDSENMARQMFLFSVCLGGLSASDVAALRVGLHIKKISGKMWLSKNRQKTGNPLFTPLNTIALEIYDARLRELGEGSANGPVLFGLASASYRSLVIDMSKKLGISKHITSHCTRTTFSAAMELMGEKDSTIQAMLGHKVGSTLRTHYLSTHEVTKAKAVALLDEAIRNPEKWEG